MVENIRNKIGRFIAPQYFLNFDRKVNQRVAEIMSKQDPFEILSKEFNGIFSQEYEHPEEMLDAKGRMTMIIWGWQQTNDPSFKYMCQFIMDVAGNETLKRAPITPERIQYGRALIASVVLWRREIKRLSGLYEEVLNKDKGGFDETLTIEE